MSDSYEFATHRRSQVRWIPVYPGSFFCSPASSRGRRFELAQRSRILVHGAVRYIVGLPESRGYPNSGIFRIKTFAGNRRRRRGGSPCHDFRVDSSEPRLSQYLQDSTYPLLSSGQAASVGRFHFCAACGKDMKIGVWWNLFVEGWRFRWACHQRACWRTISTRP